MGAWDNSDLKGKKGWMKTGFGMTAFNDGKADIKKMTDKDKAYLNAKPDIGIFGQALNWGGGAKGGDDLSAGQEERPHERPADVARLRGPVGGRDRAHEPVARQRCAEDQYGHGAEGEEVLRHLLEQECSKSSVCVSDLRRAPSSRRIRRSA